MTIPPHVICPQCGAELVIQPERGVCSAGHVYPVLLGRILDLMPGEEEKTAVVQQLLSAFDTANYARLDEILFRSVKSIPESVLATYKTYAATAIERNRRITQMFRSEALKHYGANGTATAFELGCGHGGNLIALSQDYEYVVGLDPNLPSLILAKKLLDEQGVANVFLIHGYGQNIPYAEESFDYVTAVNVLEHVFEIEAVVGAVHRILRLGGVFVADSRNRYDLFFPEPHVQVRWVGLVPRRWAKIYVRWRTGMEYNDARLLSYLELSRAFNKYFGGRHKILCAKVSAYGYPRAFDTWVDRLEHVPLIAQLTRLVFPSHLVVAQKQAVAG